MTIWSAVSAQLERKGTVGIARAGARFGSQRSVQARTKGSLNGRTTSFVVQTSVSTKPAARRTGRQEKLAGSIALAPVSHTCALSANKNKHTIGERCSSCLEKNTDEEVVHKCTCTKRTRMSSPTSNVHADVDSPGKPRRCTLERRPVSISTGR